MTGDVPLPRTTYAYVGLKPCGCVVAATVDRPEWAKDTAKTIARWIREGRTVERRTLPVFFNKCQCEALPEPLPLLRVAPGASPASTSSIESERTQSKAPE